jgi:hypothetical protein
VTRQRPTSELTRRSDFIQFSIQEIFENTLPPLTSNDFLRLFASESAFNDRAIRCARSHIVSRIQVTKEPTSPPLATHAPILASCSNRTQLSPWAKKCPESSVGFVSYPAKALIPMFSCDRQRELQHTGSFPYSLRPQFRPIGICLPPECR